MGSLNKKASGAQCFIMALGLFWDVVTGLPWTPNGVGSLEPKGCCTYIFLPAIGAYYLTINSPYGADSSLNKLLRYYYHSYLTSNGQYFSISYRFREIFDSKVFRVRPWPLTPKSHLGSKNVIPFESRYTTSYLTSMDNISLSHTAFEIAYSTSKFLGFDLDLWPLKVIWGQKFVYRTIGKPIHDCLFDFYGHHLSISYRSSDNAGQNFEGRTKWRILTFKRSCSSFDFFLS